jgi:uncharacterized membrane protein
MPVSFLLTEFSAFLIGGLVLLHAVRNRKVSILLAAIAYGFLLEYHTVKTETDYCYGRFLVMMPPWPSLPDPTCEVGPRVPLWGSVVWGYFIYGAMLTSSRLTMPWAIRPLFDGLLVLTFDWVMDPVAAALGFWTWSSRGSWFGIPLDNYFGWFMVVWAFSFTLRALQRRVPPASHGLLRNTLVQVLAIVVATLLLGAGLEIFVHLSAVGVSQAFMLWGTVAGALLVVVPALWRAVRTKPLDPLIVASVVFHHLWNGVLLAYTGLWRTEPTLSVVWAVALSLSLLGYCLPGRKPVGDPQGA